MIHKDIVRDNDQLTPTRLVIFQQNDSGAEKIKGIREFGKDIIITEVYSVKAQLPEFIDEPQNYINDDFMADVVLSFLRHPDLNHYLARICRKRDIPLIASGTKTEEAITPFTCCGLGRLQGLGHYGDQFGLPEFEIDTRDGMITDIRVMRGASCGATWQAAKKIIGLRLEEALPTLAREVQYLCKADPSAFDPITGKSALHYAGDVHTAALKKAAQKK